MKNTRNSRTTTFVDKFFDAPTIGRMNLVSRTIGIGFSRSRQPTGRMLADVLRRSFEETKMTGLGGDLSTSPVQVINNYVKIYGDLYKNMSNAFRAAGVTDDEDVGNQPGWTYDPISFKIDVFNRDFI